MDKICSKCGETKDISLFAKDRHSSDGLMPSVATLKENI